MFRLWQALPFAGLSWYVAVEFYRGRPARSGHSAYWLSWVSISGLLILEIIALVLILSE
jgi:hypothetical protein